MFYIKMDHTINKIMALYNLFGIWKREEKTIYHKWGRKLLQLIMSLSFVLSLMSGALKSDNFDQMIFLSAATVGVSVITLKLIYILWKKNEILYFLRSIAVHCIAYHQQFTQISRKFRFFMKFTSFYYAMSFVGIVAFAIIGLPIFSDKKDLPLNIGSPFVWRNNEISKEISYWMAYAYLVMVLIFHGAYMSINVVIWYIMFCYSIKYQILEMRFKNIGTNRSTISTKVARKKISESEKHKLLLHELIELIKTHQNIQKTIGQFKSCFEKLFFAQISTSGICICGFIFVLTVSSHENLVQSIIYVVAMLYNLFDIFMIMYLGNEIKLFSGRLSYGLFQSNWINQSKSSKKCILILMEILKKPQELVIAFVYPLNLETFTSILQFVYSSFNILQNLK